jgi:hypothetical protein
MPKISKAAAFPLAPTSAVEHSKAESKASENTRRGAVPPDICLSYADITTLH